MLEKGNCKHGEFNLLEGCHQCIADRMGEEGNTEAGIAEAIEELQVEHIGISPLTTALSLRPGEDIEVHGYYEEAMKALEYAETRVIVTREDNMVASDDLSLISKLKKAMEAKKREYLDPLREKAEAIRETYSTLMDPIIRADRITRDKMLAYSQEQERIRRKQEEINRKRLEAAQQEMKLKGELTESVNLVEVVPETKRVSTDLGTSGITKIKKWEVEDLSKVPLDYMMIDVAKVGKVVRAGIPSIPGIRIWEESSLRVTAR